MRGSPKYGIGAAEMFKRFSDLVSIILAWRAKHFHSDG